MEVTLSGRMGGPEMAVKYHAEIVQARASLKSAFAELSIDGLETIDVELWISGSLTEYCPERISSSARFSAKKKVLCLLSALQRTRQRPSMMIALHRQL